MIAEDEEHNTFKLHTQRAMSRFLSSTPEPTCRCSARSSADGAKDNFVQPLKWESAFWTFVKPSEGKARWWTWGQRSADAKHGKPTELDQFRTGNSLEPQTPFQALLASPQSASCKGIHWPLVTRFMSVTLFFLETADEKRSFALQQFGFPASKHCPTWQVRNAQSVQLHTSLCANTETQPFIHQQTTCKQILPWLFSSHPGMLILQQKEVICPCKILLAARKAILLAGLLCSFHCTWNGREGEISMLWQRAFW